MAADSLTSSAWARVDQRYRLRERLLGGEAVFLSADELKEVGQREPRLMTKFDTRESRPALLAAATVLPVTNGGYVVLPGDGYHDLQELETTRRWVLPAEAASLQTLPWSTGPCSEAQALDMALAAGVLADFLAERRIHLTVRGRRRSPKFEFDFRCAAESQRIVAEGVQIEVDSGLEGANIHLVEGKLGSRDNFHIRQLYYPMRMWKDEVQGKDVSAIFMAWSNRRFALRRYAFEPSENYHGIRLADAVDYVLDPDEEPPTLAKLLDYTRAERLREGVPFPQADDLRKVIDVIDAVGSGRRSQATIAESYGFDKRQADYYGNAAAFLGLLDRGRKDFSLSPAGRRFLVSPRPQRSVLIAERIASLPVLRDALEWVAAHGEAPQSDTVAEWIRAATGLGGATPARRALTVLAWTRWVNQVLA